MTDAVSITLDTRDFDRAIARLTDGELGRWGARTINRVSFDVLDAERSHIRSVFDFAGGTTERFLAGRGSIVFDGASPGKLESRIYPAPSGRRGKTQKPKREQTLLDHQRGARIVAGEGSRLAVLGRLAVPSGKRLRTTRGRIPKRSLPSSMLSDGGRGYIAQERYIFERSTVQGQPSDLRYVLLPSAELKPVLDYFGVARGVVAKQFTFKAREEFLRMRLR